MPSLPDGPAIDRVTQGTAFHRHPLAFLRHAHKRYGDVFTLRLAITGTVVVVADPAHIGEVAGISKELGHAGEARQRVLGMVSERSVLGADEDVHTRARSALEPVFTPEAMDARRDAMREIAVRHAAGWPTGRPFRLVPKLRALSDEIFLRLVVGIADEERAAALLVAVRRMLWTPGYPPSPPPGMQAGGLLGAAGRTLFERRVKPVRALLSQEVEERIAGADEGGTDLVAALLRARGPRTADIVDELIPILMAGQEPPACGLTWLLDRLAREPELAEHVRTAPDGDPFTDAIERETFRLRPPVHSVVRVLTAPATIAGVELPAGVATMVPMVLVHRDPRAFEDPDSFRPQRFMNGGESTTHPALLPFGGGARRCLGEPLAHAMLGTVVPAVLDTVKLRPLWPAPERMVIRGTVVAPHRSELVLATDAA